MAKVILKVVQGDQHLQLFLQYNGNSKKIKCDGAVGSEK